MSSALGPTCTRDPIEPVLLSKASARLLAPSGPFSSAVIRLSCSLTSTSSTLVMSSTSPVSCSRLSRTKVRTFPSADASASSACESSWRSPASVSETRASWSMNRLTVLSLRARVVVNASRLRTVANMSPDPLPNVSAALDMSRIIWLAVCPWPSIALADAASRVSSEPLRFAPLGPSAVDSSSRLA